MKSEALVTSRVYTDFQGLSDLRHAARDNDSPEALDEVARQFEALFVQMMLKSMRDANLGDGIFDSDQSQMYQGLFDQQMAIDMATQRSFGIADVLVKQLQANLKFKDNTDEPAVNPAQGVTSAPVKAEKHIQQFDSPDAFVDAMRPLAEKAAYRLGINPRVLIAQAALETGWGQKIIRNADGSSHNLFGIKADERWNGPRTLINTLEFRNGEARREHAVFRVYDSFQQSFEDYIQFIQQDRYREALAQPGDAGKYIHALQRAGYATDPHYAEKVMDIMQRQQI